MASIEHQLTEIYVIVDDYLKTHPAVAQWRHSPNATPALTDAEVMTIGLMQGCLGVATLKQTYLLIAMNHKSAFPKLCSYNQWLARLHRLNPLIGCLLGATRSLGPRSLYLMDSKPIPVCLPIRHGRVRLLREDGAYFGKSSKGLFFGFKLHALMTVDGQLQSAFLTPANWNDRDLALALGWAVPGGVVLADLGYVGQEIAQVLADEADLLLITPADAGDRRALVSTLRERIETVFSQLWHRFIDRVYSRSWLGLWNTLMLKLLNYTFIHAGLLTPTQD